MTSEVNYGLGFELPDLDNLRYHISLVPENPFFNEFSQIRSFSCVPQTLSGGAIDFVSSTEVKIESAI